MHNYCTIFSRDSLYRGLLFYRSLKNHDKDFRLFIVFLHDEVRQLVERMRLENTVLINHSVIESGDEGLRSVMGTRGDQEYAWTLKAPMMLHIFKNYPNVESLVYIDGDVEFYSSPEPIFEELQKYSLLLTRERFYIQDNEAWYENYGKYNGGFLAFNRNQSSMQILEWLRDKCLGWCFNRVEDGKYGDQKFIDEIETHFQGVGISKNMGINTTAWYSHASVMEARDGRFYVNEVPITFYHYSGMIQYAENEFDLCVYVSLPKKLVSLIYIPYLRRLKAISRFVEQYDSSFGERNLEENKSGYFKNYFKFEESVLPVAESTASVNHNFCTIVGRDYVIKGIALHDSLKKHSENFHLWICCLDNSAKDMISAMKLENTTLVNFDKVEDDRLLSVKGNRSTSEYCWTLKSSWMLYLLNRNPDIKSLVYLDADMFFFSDASQVFEELKSCSVLLCPQRDLTEVEKQFGRFQAGFIGVTRDNNSMEFLNWWRSKCLEWCSSEQGLEDRWGDQKYLDRVPETFQGVRVTDNWGIDSAIWSIKNNMTLRGAEVYVRNSRLVSYHFCCVEIFNEEDFALWTWPNWRVDEGLAEYVYLPYIKALRYAMQRIREAGFNVISLWADNSKKSTAINYYRYVHRS